MKDHESSNEPRNFDRLVKEMFQIARQELPAVASGHSENGNIIREYGFHINYLNEINGNEPIIGDCAEDDHSECGQHQHFEYDDLTNSYENIAVTHSLNVERVVGGGFGSFKSKDFVYTLNNSVSQSLPLHEIAMPDEFWLDLADDYGITISEELPSSKYPYAILAELKAENWAIDSEVMYHASYFIEPAVQSIKSKFSRENIINGETYYATQNYELGAPKHSYIKPETDSLTAMDSLIFDSTIQKLLEDDSPLPANVDIAEALVIARCIKSRKPWLKNNNFING